jgi:hypothetical protein
MESKKIINKKTITDTEYLSGNLSFVQKAKYKFHKSVSQIFNDDEFIQNYVHLNNNYLAVRDLIPTWLYDEDYGCFVNDNSIGFVLEGNTISGADEKTVKTITNLITDGMPEGAVIQVNNFASPKINNILGLWGNSRKSPNEIHKALTDKRKNILKRQIGRVYLPRLLY